MVGISPDDAVAIRTILANDGADAANAELLRRAPWMTDILTLVPRKKAVITAAQCRAARALLDITQNDSACRSGVGISTISNFEKGLRRPSLKCLTAIQSTLEQAGVEFIYQSAGGRGVLLRSEARAVQR